MMIFIKVYDEKTKTWIVTKVRGEIWEDKSRELTYIRFFETTIVYGNEYPIFEGEKE